MNVSRLMETPIYRLYGALMCLDEKLVAVLALYAPAEYPKYVEGLVLRRAHVLRVLQARWGAKFSGRRPPFLKKTKEAGIL